MLSDEEKTALEFIKINNKHKYCGKDDVDFLLNLIEKQSKEIEDNKKYIDLHYVPYEQYTSKLNELNKKWKDKIKTKIEELEREKEKYFEKQVIQHEIEVLQSLLEKE